MRTPTDELAELNRTVDWYERVLGSTRDAFVSIDRHARIERFNPAAEEMFGYRAHEVLGQKVNVLMAEPYRTEHDGYIARYEETKEARAIGRIRVVAAVRKGGETFPLELSVTRVSRGDEIQYVAFLRDITEKMKLQGRAVEQERLAAIGATSATFAHEVGNPLNSMSMHAQLLERRLAKLGDVIDEGIRGNVTALQSELTRLTNLMAEFRALARRDRMSVLPTNLDELAREVLRAESPVIHGAGVRVTTDLAEGMRAELVDGGKIKQVLLNLVKNAVEAMPDGGELHVAGSITDDDVIITVRDSGVGIREGVDPFEPFATTKLEGTGLGLPVARQIVSAHGGTLSYEAAPQGGTAFTLALPRIAAGQRA